MAPPKDKKRKLNPGEVEEKVEKKEIVKAKKPKKDKVKEEKAKKEVVVSEDEGRVSPSPSTAVFWRS